MFYFGILLAGGSGALLRYFLGRATIAMGWTALPFGTLLANIIGSFLIGYLSWALLHRWSLSSEMQTILITGFLGGFTTFSAFSLDVIKLLEAGSTSRALIYVLASVLASILMCFLGLALARQASL